MDLRRELGQLKHFFFVGGRAFGVLILAGLLLAACGDDDDDEIDINGDTNGTPDVELTVTDDEDTGAAGDETSTEENGDATTPEEDTDATGTEGEDDVMATEDEDLEITEEEATEEDEAMAGTETEEDTDTNGTATDEDAAGTETEEDAAGTETEEDQDAVGTETEEDDMTATEDEDQAEATGTAGDATGDTAEFGEPVEVGNLTITVEGASEFMGVPGVIEADEGQFIAVDVIVQNAGEEPLSVIDLLGSMYIETADGQQYDPDVLANAALLLQDQGIIDQVQQTDGEIVGSVGFDVPSDAGDMTLVIEPDGAGDPVRFDLSEQLGS